MQSKPEILYIADLARRLGRTESGVRMAVHRRSESVPPHFKLGNRIAWNAADVTAWLRKKARAS